MREHAETFHANKGSKLAIVVFRPTSPLQNKNFWYFFQRLFARRRGLVHPYFLYENESLQHCISYDLKQMAIVLVIEDRFFQRVCFLERLFFLRSRVLVSFRLIDDARLRRSLINFSAE